MEFFAPLPLEEQLHCRRVAAVSKLIAESMGCSNVEVTTIERAAMFHDVGKTAIPTELLNKSGELTKRERAVVLSHTTVGKQMLDGTESILSTAAIVALQHHEHLDGSGYFGLTDKAIHPHAKMVAVADVFDKLMFCRLGPEKEKIENACDTLLQCAGKKLDARLIHMLLSNFDQALVVCHMVNINAYNPENAHL